MRELADDAVVLRTWSEGEADRTATLYTRRAGRIRVIARGARKTTNRLGAALEPLAVVRVDLIQGRGERFIVRHVDSQRHLTTLRANYERITAGYSVVEAIDATPADHLADEARYELLVRVLEALDDPALRPDLVPAAFFLRLLALDGAAPVLDSCVSCGRREPLVAFDAATGGALCAQCRRGRAVSAAALALLRRIAGGELGVVLREVGPPGTDEVRALMGAAIEEHLGRRMRTLAASPEASR